MQPGSSAPPADPHRADAAYTAGRPGGPAAVWRPCTGGTAIRVQAGAEHPRLMTPVARERNGPNAARRLVPTA